MPPCVGAVVDTSGDVSETGRVLTGYMKHEQRSIMDGATLLILLAEALQTPPPNNMRENWVFAGARAGKRFPMRRRKHN